MNETWGRWIWSVMMTIHRFHTQACDSAETPAFAESTPPHHWIVTAVPDSLFCVTAILPVCNYGFRQLSSLSFITVLFSYEPEILTCWMWQMLTAGTTELLVQSCSPCLWRRPAVGDAHFSPWENIFGLTCLYIKYINSAQRNGQTCCIKICSL